ncbi:MAG: alpha-L-fucosidase, partial [Verrucomicrobiota bacterium]
MNTKNILSRRSFLKAGITVAAAAPILSLAAGFPSPGRPRSAFDGGREWWFQARYGMFVHWGLYAINGWHEQDHWRRRIPRAEYVKLQQQWNPVNFNPDH